MAKDTQVNGKDFILEIDLSEFSHQMTHDGKLIVYVNSWGKCIPLRTRFVGEKNGLSYSNIAVGDRGGIATYTGNYNYHQRPEW